MHASSARGSMEVTLSRGLGLLDVTMIGVGAMIGAGIFGLTGLAAGEAGPVGLLVAFILNGFITSLTGLTYAELGAAIPEAGGGYLWVREGLSRFWGFFAGWISWFSHSVACSLYAVIFGTFFVELLKWAGVHLGTEPIFLGLSVEQWAVKITTVLVALLFMYINFRGASETGTVGNFITILKIVVLLTVSAFGLRLMLGNPEWPRYFLDNPFPHGLAGVLTAMGLTFVAFEGYEIIAQSGEELVEPEKNLPRAIFLSIAIVVSIYLLVAFVSVGALTPDMTDGLPSWVYLGREGERAMIRMAERVMPYGTLVMIIGGLASTTSALNATVYSSSRVSFAMGRGGDLPRIFGRVHPRTRTPHIAILFSGILIIFMAVTLPIADVASGASLTFLILFLLTNITLIRLRKTHPDLPRPFKVPLVPWVPIFATAAQALLAVDLFRASPIAWYVTLAWFALGVGVYHRWGRRAAVREQLDTVLLEEAITPGRQYTVMLPVARVDEAREVGKLAAVLARYYEGEVFAVHVIRVPRPLSLSHGRAFLKQARPLLEEVVKTGKAFDVPVRTQLRLGREIVDSLVQAVREREANLLLLSWLAPPTSPEAMLGDVVDELSLNPPCNLVVARLLREYTLPKRILVPVAGGPHVSLALEVALAQAAVRKEMEQAQTDIVALHVLPREASPEEAQKVQAELLAMLQQYPWPIELRVIVGENDIVHDILAYAKEHEFDQIVLGASEEGLLKRTLFGTIPQKVAEEADLDVLMVKRYLPLQHGLQRWLGRLGLLPAKNNNGRPPQKAA